MVEDTSAKPAKEAMKQLVNHLRNSGSLQSERISRVMSQVDRRDFVSPHTPQRAAYSDCPLSIDFNVTISAPHMHAMCMEWLEHKLIPGAKVLDVGCGSGYLCATFYELTKQEQADGSFKAHVIGIEHI